MKHQEFRILSGNPRLFNCRVVHTLRYSQSTSKDKGEKENISKNNFTPVR